MSKSTIERNYVVSYEDTVSELCWNEDTCWNYVQESLFVSLAI